MPLMMPFYNALVEKPKNLQVNFGDFQVFLVSNLTKFIFKTFFCNILYHSNQSNSLVYYETGDWTSKNVSAIDVLWLLWSSGNA